MSAWSMGNQSPYTELLNQQASTRSSASAAAFRHRTWDQPPVGLNLFLIFVVLGGTFFQLFVLPLLLHGVGLQAAWFLLPIMLIQPLHWSLIHEAIHSHLLPGRRAEAFWTRLLSVTHWLPFDATRFCHLVHHRYSRHAYDRADVYNGRGAYSIAWLRYRWGLCGGIYIGLLMTPLIAFVPVSRGARLMANTVPLQEEGDSDVRRLFVSLVNNSSKRRRTRRDFATALALYCTSAWLYGGWWPVLLAAMYVRGVWYSLADNLAHHDVAHDEPSRARNHTLPRVLGLVLMNHHLHLTHHRVPQAPWLALGRMRSSEEMRGHGNYFTAAIRQFGPSYPRIISPQK